MSTIADLFESRLNNLLALSRESDKKTQALLDRTKKLLKEIQDIDLEIED